MGVLNWADVMALLQVVLIDVTLAGDNAVIVGLAVVGLPQKQRRWAIGVGLTGAAVMRIGLGAITVHLLAIVGLLLAGGLLLLWVCWKSYRELRHASKHDGKPPAKTLGQAMLQILLADLSMSLDNVLAVAGASDGKVWILAFGLVLSVLLMGLAAQAIANLLERHRWLAWVGLAIVLVVALKLIWEGGHEVFEHLVQ
jgi:YjbE family integral membrane protein